MGFLSKVNPTATLLSVIAQAAIKGVVGCVLGLILCYWKGWPDHWPLGLLLWSLLSAFVGAVFEWQVPEEDWGDDSA